MKEKQLKDYLKKISLSSMGEPVRTGEITLMMNVLERLNHQSPAMFDQLLKNLKLLASDFYRSLELDE